MSQRRSNPVGRRSAIDHYVSPVIPFIYACNAHFILFNFKENNAPEQPRVLRDILLIFQYRPSIYFLLKIPDKLNIFHLRLQNKMCVDVLVNANKPIYREIDCET